jgi:uncharacterized protein (DUF362 family)/Pyruvate/2-oxoacid:ferredoxin oxidoreductase delta subunit
MVKTIVAIQKILNDDIKTAVFNALELINAKKLMTKEGMNIVLKPNLLMGKPPERAVNTHPEIVRSVIHWVKQFNPTKIFVCDSSGGQKPGVTETAMRESGIDVVCKEEGVECIPFEKTEREIYTVGNPLEIQQFSSSHLLKEADLIINLPKVKTHGQCKLTCCIKNMFGTVLLSNKPKTHAQAATLDRFTSALVDIYSVSNPQLTIVDGYYGMEGQGPSSGDPVKLDLILAGYDGIALDRTVCDIIGFDSSEVLYLAKAEQQGLGTADLSQIEYKGESVENVKKKFNPPKIRPVSMPLPKWLSDYVGRTIFKARVKFNRDECKLCSTCWTNCPVGAISPPGIIKKGNIPKWDKNKCITCFCCVELCPYEAVNFKINFIRNAVLSWLGLGFIGLIFVISLFILWLTQL